jgi:MFS family permease
MLPVLIGYLLFGAGYIGYMTFMIAWVREAGGGAIVQSAFWSLIGVGGIVAPWLWSRLIGRTSGGRAIAILSAVTLVGATVPLGATSAAGLYVSAAIFGCAFFSVTAATTAFVRRSYPPAAWPKGIAAMTVAFGTGQTVGPVLIGAITDLGGSLSLGLSASTVLLALTVVAALCQKDFCEWKAEIETKIR